MSNLKYLNDYETSKTVLDFAKDNNLKIVNLKRQNNVLFYKLEFDETLAFYKELENNTVNFDYETNKYLYDNILEML